MNRRASLNFILTCSSCTSKQQDFFTCVHYNAKFFGVLHGRFAVITVCQQGQYLGCHSRVGVWWPAAGT